MLAFKTNLTIAENKDVENSLFRSEKITVSSLYKESRGLYLCYRPY